MKQVTITTGKVKMLVVDLPQGATLAGIVRDHLYYYSSSMTHDDYPYSEIIPDGFEGTECFQGVWHITEEDWKGIVDKVDWYYNYLHKVQTRRHMFDTATESGLSILKANGVVMENPYGVSKDYVINNSSAKTYEEKLKEADLWRKAQEKVWLNPHIFIKL